MKSIEKIKLLEEEIRKLKKEIIDLEFINEDKQKQIFWLCEDKQYIHHYAFDLLDYLQKVNYTNLNKEYVDNVIDRIIDESRLFKINKR